MPTYNYRANPNSHPDEQPQSGQSFWDTGKGDDIVVSGPASADVVVKAVGRDCNGQKLHDKDLFGNTQNSGEVDYDIQGKLRGWSNRLDTHDKWGYFELRNKKLHGPPGGTPPKIPPG